jgi:hypothetical protein
MSWPAPVLIVPEFAMPKLSEPVIVVPMMRSLPAKVLAVSLLTIASSSNTGTISSSSVNVIAESWIVIGKPQYEDKNEKVL